MISRSEAISTGIETCKTLLKFRIRFTRTCTILLLTTDIKRDLEECPLAYVVGHDLPGGWVALGEEAARSTSDPDRFVRRKGVLSAQSEHRGLPRRLLWLALSARYGEQGHCARPLEAVLLNLGSK